MKTMVEVESLMPDGFVRLEAQEEAVKKALQEVSIVGLVGVGGIGKTTLARAVYQSICKDFERSCYVNNVKSKTSLDEVLITLLQNFGIKDRKSSCIVERNALQDCKKSLLEDLKTYVQQHKVLVVVDDVGTKENFACLLKDMDFLNGNKESKVIVTCRNWQVLKDKVQGSGKYEVEPMSFGQDIELFAYHAFKGARTLEQGRQILLGFLSKDSSEYLIEEFESICSDVVKACGGLPLSLEVMGCCMGGYLINGNLSSMECLGCWKGVLEKLECVQPLEGGNDNDRLWKVLQISYDCLHENERNMFLDIACFFCDSMRYNEETLLRIWGGELSKLIEFKNLKERGLVKIKEEDESVIMHDQLRDMARNVVKRQCKGDLNKMTRVWDLEDVRKLLQNNEIIAPQLQGLSLEEWGITSMAIIEGSPPEISEQQKTSKWKGPSPFILDCPLMRLLNLHEVWDNVTQTISINIISRIQWLCLKGTDIYKLPKFVQVCNELCVLDLRDCKDLKNLDESIGNLVNLLELNLSECMNLVTIPNSLGDMVSLAKLDLSGCKRLTSVPDSIGNLVKLSTLHVSRCKGLKCLPDSIGNLVNLSTLDVSNCKGLKSLPDSIGNLVNLSTLDLSGCQGLKSLPDSIGNLVNLSTLHVFDCEGLTSLPDSIGNLVNLSTIDLSRCQGLRSLPDSIGNLMNLSTLHVSHCEGLTRLPDSIGNLVNLSTIDLSRCQGLRSLPNSIGNLVNLSTLRVSHCKGLTSLPDSIGNLVNLSTLDVSNCKGLTSLPNSIGNLVKLSTLDLSGCHGLRSLPNSIGNLVNLSTLDVSNCKGLTSLPNSIGNLVNLSTIDVSNCKGLTSLPDSIGNLVNLSTLDLFGCQGLKSLPDSIGNLVNLSTLRVSHCKGLTSLPDSIGNLVNLSTLDVSNCKGLKSLPNSIGNLVKLSTLDLSSCQGLRSLPNSIGNLVNLSTLHVFDCEGLTSLPDSIGNLGNLSTLHISSCEGLRSLPDSIGNLVNLSTLDIYFCKGLTSLPDSIGNLVKLSTLDVSHCEGLTNLPDSIGNLVNLSTLNVFGCEGLTSLPNSIGNLVNLSRFSLQNEMLQRKMTLRDILETRLVKKSIRDEDMLFNSGTLQTSDLDTFQKDKHHRISDISYSDGYYFHDHLNDETMKDISKVQEAEVEMLGMLPPYSSTNAHDISNARPTIKPANTQNKQPYQPVSPGHDMEPESPDEALKFSMADLNIITRNFSESLPIGHRDPGSVYQGQLKDGTMVAVKRIKKDDKNALEIEDAWDFQTEVDTLSKEEHLNLVRVLGFLEDENELILVTEYVTNGNLRQHLDGVPYGVILDMFKRCRISLDVVTALKHLHNQTKDDVDIIHRDIKSSDILITDDFRAKVAGFGLSRCSPSGDISASSNSTLVKGTLAYMACEHLTTHYVKEQNDVYAFGELLVEIFTGKRLIESNLPNDECFTSRWVLKQCVEGRLMDIIDPKITPTTFNLKILEPIFKLATSCLALEESNCPTVEDVFLNFSFIVGHYFGDLNDESNSKGDKYEVQEERKWDLEACIEPNLQTLCLEELVALKGQEPTKHLDKANSSSSSFMPTKPHGSLFVEDLESNKVQTSVQLDTQLEVDSQQATSALQLVVAKEDETSPLFIDIIPDMFPSKTEETYFRMLQEEIAKLGYISRLLNQGDDFEQNLTYIGITSFFLYFNEKDDVFEFYFKDYQGMASIVGVGLECAKVVLEDGWRVTIQEISKSNWDDVWKNFEFSSSTMKVTVSQPWEEGMDNMEDSQGALASIPRGQCLLLDLAKYFTLKKAIASFLPRSSMTHANTNSGTSSSSSSQDIARSSSSSDGKSLSLLQAVKNLFISQVASNQLKTKNGDGPPMDPPSNDDVKIDTTVHLKLLPGGCLYDGNTPLDVPNLDNNELKELTSQLDKTIYLAMMFKFLNEVDRKEIQVIVGPISFQLGVKHEVNYQTTRRFGWYHKLLDVSFGPVNTCDSEIGPNHSALDISKVKKTITKGSSDATTRGTSNSMNGGVQGKIPQVFTLSGGGSSGWSTTKCISDNVGYTIEKEFEETRGGFSISSEHNLLSSTLIYTYHAPDYMHELDYEKLPCEDYRKYVLKLQPICKSQDVKFEGTWLPKDLENNPQVAVEYSLHTSREVHMTSKEICEKFVKKSRITMKRGHHKIQKQRNEPLKYTQKYTRSIFLNHAMTHLNGKEFRVREVPSQQSLNQREPETHLEIPSCYAREWLANPLVGLNSELHYQP